MTNSLSLLTAPYHAASTVWAIDAEGRGRRLRNDYAPARIKSLRRFNDLSRWRLDAQTAHDHRLVDLFKDRAGRMCKLRR